MRDWNRIVNNRLSELGLDGATTTELAIEWSQHLEDRYRELLSGGTDEPAAYQLCLQELTSLHNARRTYTGLRAASDLEPPAVTRSSWLTGIPRDVRYAVRSLRRTPVLTVFIALTLALGIGANTVVFTIINTIILHPIPVNTKPLVSVIGADTAGGKATNGLFQLSYADLKDYQHRNRVFQSLAGYTSPRMMTMRGSQRTERLFGELVTASYFDALGLKPAHGRFFVADDDKESNGQPGAVLNYGTWQARFGGKESVLGQNITVNNVVFTIVGIAPKNFIGVNAIFGPEVWVPAAFCERLYPNEFRDHLADRQREAFTGVGLLRAGVTRAQAQADVSAIASSLMQEHVGGNERRTAKALSVTDILFVGANGGSTPVVFASVVLLAVVGVVLLMACANVANLLLARSAARRQEMAIRLAMGANRSRLLQQLLTESMLFSLLGGVGGIALGYTGLQILFSQLPNAATFVTPRLDVSVLLYALLISLATSVIFGAAPAFSASRANVIDTLKDESRSSGRNRSKVTFANALIVAQVALSFVLLLTAALFLRSIGRAYEMDPGFQTSHLVLIMTNLGQEGYRQPDIENFYRDVRDHVRSLPGVTSVSWSSNIPLWNRPLPGVQIEGVDQRSRTDTIRSIVNTADEGYFAAAGVHLINGREFAATDSATSTPVAIVNEKLARDYFPSGAIGRRVQIPGEKQMRQIVGVARTANYTAWGEAPQLCIYVPLRQKFSDAMTLYVRSNGEPAPLVAPVERAIRDIAPSVVLPSVRTGAEIVQGGLFQARMAVALLTIFGVLALGLASVGLYGIIMYSVNQRKHEIGLRMALGANSTSVLKMIFREAMSLVGTGVLLGLLGALIVGGVLKSLLYGVSATDPISLAIAGFVLLAVAFIACTLPALRATRVDPVTALREA